jgi:diguanylate cyclase (GGDEF)-like protein
MRNGRLLDQLRHEAAHDALTGLPNRAHFQRATADALLAAESGDARGQHRAAVMIMDLDGFKEVNDTLGHTQGDLVLKEVARRLSIAAQGAATVARIGGDEFAVLVERAFDPEYATAVARRLLATLEQPVVLESLDIALSASLGIACRRSTAPTSRTCSSAPTSRCTAPRPTPPASPCTRRDRTPARRSGWRWSATCAARWTTASSTCTSSPR